MDIPSQTGGRVSGICVKRAGRPSIFMIITFAAITLPSAQAAFLYVDAECVPDAGPDCPPVRAGTPLDDTRYGAQPGEYIDLVSNIVYRESAGQLVVAGSSLPSLGYVMLSTWTNPPNGRADCSSSMVACYPPVNDCGAQVCHYVHVAVTGCPEVVVTTSLFEEGATFPYAASSKEYETCGSTPPPFVVGTGVIETVDRLVGSGAGAVTLVEDKFSPPAGCLRWIPRAGEPSPYVPARVHTSLTINGKQEGWTNAQLCW